MEPQQLIDRLSIAFSNLESNYSFMANKAKENRERLDMLAEACSDLILGGENGWREMEFDAFVALVREALHRRWREEFSPVKIKERQVFPGEY